MALSLTSLYTRGIILFNVYQANKWIKYLNSFSTSALAIVIKNIFEIEVVVINNNFSFKLFSLSSIIVLVAYVSF